MSVRCGLDPVHIVRIPEPEKRGIFAGTKCSCSDSGRIKSQSWPYGRFGTTDRRIVGAEVPLSATRGSRGGACLGHLESHRMPHLA